jgi:phage terminase small subunit
MTENEDAFNEEDIKFLCEDDEVREAYNNLNQTEKSFICHYIKNGFNGSRAAQSAGIGGTFKSSGVAASVLLKKPRVKRFMYAYNDDVFEKAGFTNKFIIEKLMTVISNAEQGVTNKDGVYDAKSIVKAIEAAHAIRTNERDRTRHKNEENEEDKLDDEARSYMELCKRQVEEIFKREF